MIKERFLVRGKRLDNGEIIQGYYLHNDGYCDRPDGARAFIYRTDYARDAVDPATVEPIVVKPRKSDAGSSICPNCEHFIMQYEQSHGNITVPYCKWCGQRLDWGVEQ